jgi:hypothetical protein
MKVVFDRLGVDHTITKKEKKQKKVTAYMERVERAVRKKLYQLKHGREADTNDLLRLRQDAFYFRTPSAQQQAWMAANSEHIDQFQWQHEDGTVQTTIPGASSSSSAAAPPPGASPGGGVAPTFQPFAGQGRRLNDDDEVVEKTPQPEVVETPQPEVEVVPDDDEENVEVVADDEVVEEAPQPTVQEAPKPTTDDDEAFDKSFYEYFKGAFAGLDDDDYIGQRIMLDAVVAELGEGEKDDESEGSSPGASPGGGSGEGNLTIPTSNYNPIHIDIAKPLDGMD